MVYFLIFYFDFHTEVR